MNNLKENSKEAEEQQAGSSNVEDPILLNEQMFKVYIVHTILSKDTEKAVELVCRRNHVKPPSLRIGGVPKGHKKALGVYSVASNTIAFRDQEQFFDPFVVLHELYHCIRSKSGTHKGTEKNADHFAISFIEEYNKFAKSLSDRIQTKIVPEVD